jgi:probable F420-dependent oxidoreductase
MKFGASMFFTGYSMTSIELAQALEQRGFEIMWAPEHSHIPLSRKTPFPLGAELPKRYYDVMDPFVTLSAAAAATKTLKVGTGVCLIVQRDPIQTAKLVASIDQVSGGRFVFGVGNGWNQDEIENHGTVFASRHKLARERIEAMKMIWTEEEPEYHGEFVNFDKMKQWPKPKQKPHPPIIVGGAFPYAARRAIRYGDGWIPRADRLEKDGVGVVIEKFRAMASEAGRDPATLPISIFRVPDKIDGLRFCQEIGIDRVTFTLPAEKEDKLLPIIDRWAELKHQLGD